MAKNNLQKLELTWIGKGEEPKLEPRILIEQPEYSYGQNHKMDGNQDYADKESSGIQKSATLSDSDNCHNMLILPLSPLYSRS